MDCLTTQRTLDLLRGGSAQEFLGESPVKVEGVITAPVAAEAQSHLVGCEACQDVVSRRLRFDARVGEACRNVPVPMGLRERLIAAVQAAEAADALADCVPAAGLPLPAHAPQPVAVPQFVSTRPVSTRRTMLKRLTACALLVLAGIMGWTLWPQKRVALDQVVQATTAPALDAASLVAYPRTAPLPQELLVPASLDRQPVRQLSINGIPAAIRFFTVRNRKHVSVAVRLVSLPRKSVWIATASSSTARIAYVGSWAVWTWCEGNTQFVVALEGGEDELLRLIRRPEVI